MTDPLSLFRRHVVGDGHVLLLPFTAARIDHRCLERFPRIFICGRTRFQSMALALNFSNVQPLGHGRESVRRVLALGGAVCLGRLIRLVDLLVRLSRLAVPTGPPSHRHSRRAKFPIDALVGYDSRPMKALVRRVSLRGQGTCPPPVVVVTVPGGSYEFVVSPSCCRYVPAADSIEQSIFIHGERYVHTLLPRSPHDEHRCRHCGLSRTSLVVPSRHKRRGEGMRLYVRVSPPYPSFPRARFERVRPPHSSPVVYDTAKENFYHIQFVHPRRVWPRYRRSPSPS